MLYGRRLYFKKFDGSFIFDTGENDIESIASIDEDLMTQSALMIYNMDDLIIVELEVGQYNEEFSRATSLKYDLQTNNVIFDFIPMSDILEYHKAVKKSEIALFAKQELELGFDVETFEDGVVHHYTYDGISQKRFEKMFSVQSSPLAQTLVKWSTNKGALLDHTAEQFMTVCGVAFKYEYTIEYKQIYIDSLISNAKSIEELNVISWDMEIS